MLSLDVGEEYVGRLTGVRETVMVSFHVFVNKNKHRAVNVGNTGI